MNWLKWLFCPHKWKQISKTDVWDSSEPDAKRPAASMLLYQCETCTRLKRVNWSW